MAKHIRALYSLSVMRITLDVTKTVEENAQVYFEKSKKFKKKIDGVKEAIALYEKKLQQAEQEDQEAQEKKEKQPTQKQELIRQWYEKFRWIISSEGYLCISGMDATSNEVVIKKHTDSTDVVLHTEMAGSPFTIVKTNGKQPDQQTLVEAAQLTQAYSRAWKLGMGSTEVFHVKPEQVSKTPNPGEFIQKGSFIIRGKVTHISAPMEICVGVGKEGLHKDHIIAGSKEAMEKFSRAYAVLRQGNGKQSDLGKELLKKFALSGGHHLDDLIKFIPPGSQIKEFKKLKV